MEPRLSDKVAVVTGGSGLAVARGLAAEALTSRAPATRPA
jgi:NAD(P)-dependent dehydrogenase (short-subunit alcohol dehydrogenase family)